MNTTQRPRRALLLAGSAWVLLAGAAAAEPAATADKGQETFVPHHKVTPLPGKVVGVLASGGEALLAAEGRKGPADCLCFSTAGTSYRWVYVPVPRKPIIGGLNVRVGEKGETKKAFKNLSLANPKTVQQFGVTEPFALVEVEVNGNLGGPAEESFVATQVRVLDGSKEYPLKTTEVIAGLGKRYRDWFQEQKQAIDKGMADARKAVPSDRQPAGAREQAETVYVTWLPDSQRLRVVYQTRVTDRVSGPAVGKDPPRVTLFGVQLGSVYEVSKAGALEQTLPLPLEVFQKELPPPRKPNPDPDSK